MFYFKSMPLWQRALRLVLGGTLVLIGLVGLPGLALGYLIAGVGTSTALTGFVGFCPMCAFAVSGKRSGK